MCVLGEGGLQFQGSIQSEVWPCSVHFIAYFWSSEVIMCIAYNVIQVTCLVYVIITLTLTRSNMSSW